jgi:hypothetical protein
MGIDRLGASTAAMVPSLAFANNLEVAAFFPIL